MKCKLLVAEDELIERKVLCKTLQKYLGDLIVLYEARNGREALELFAREAPQVVILDIEMPGYTGLEVARKIRETDKNCGILFLTGYDKFAYAKQAIAVRALDYLLKPYATRMPISARGSSSASRSTFRPTSTSTGWGKHGSWCWTPASA